MMSFNFPAAIRPARRRRLPSPSRLDQWLAPSLDETVRLLPRPRQPRMATGGSLRDMLVRFNLPLRRAWLSAVARRALLCGLVIGVALTIVATEAGWPRWLGAAIGLALVATVAVRAARRSPGLAETARFLDRRLDLDEQLATALELERPDAKPSLLAMRLQQHAATSARAAADSWAPRATRATREWAGLALLLCALAGAAAIPSGGVGTAPQNAASTQGGSRQASPVPTAPAAGTRPLAVQIAVVSTQETNTTSTAHGSQAPHPVSPATARQRAAQHAAAVPRSHARSGPASHTGANSSGQKAGGKVTAAGGHTLPLLKHSENFLPTSPAAKGQKGSFYSSTQAKSGSAGRPGAQGATGGAASHATSGSAGAGKGTAQQGKQSSGNRTGSAAGKQGSSGAQASKSTQCTLFYACARLNPSQLTAPGLITGKGQFSGKGLPGGQTAGHSQGAAPKLGAAKGATPAGGHQLNITSAYGPAGAGQRAAKQAQGHNGPGSAQQSVVMAGANSAQTFDYVPPDANIVLPGENGIIGRYFTAHSAS